MKNGNGLGHGGAVFGQPDRVMVQRALAEFRAGRPVVVSSAQRDFRVALPVDGLDAGKLAAFRALCAPMKPKLVITARRAECRRPPSPTSSLIVSGPVSAGSTAHWVGTFAHRRSAESRSSAARNSPNRAGAPDRLIQPTR